MASILLSGDWGHDGNRRFTVWITSWTRLDMLMALAPHIDNLELGNQSPLSALQSGRLKARTTAHDMIKAQFITAELMAVVDDWGLTLMTTLIQENEFHMLKVEIFNGDDLITTFHLDGWSGFMCKIAGNTPIWHRARQITPEAFVRFALREIEDYLEAHT